MMTMFWILALVSSPILVLTLLKLIKTSVNTLEIIMLGITLAVSSISCGVIAEGSWQQFVGNF